MRTFTGISLTLFPSKGLLAINARLHVSRVVPTVQRYRQPIKRRVRYTTKLKRKRKRNRVYVCMDVMQGKVASSTNAVISEGQRNIDPPQNTPRSTSRVTSNITTCESHRDRRRYGHLVVISLAIQSEKRAQKKNK